MPELPEVETTLRGLKPHTEGTHIKCITVRHYGLRWSIPKKINALTAGKKIHHITRRGKYLLFDLGSATIILHLGMSGRLHILPNNLPPKKHDHVDIELDTQKIIRFTDPRRFGALLLTKDDPNQHFLLKHLGIEPLDKQFTAQYLSNQAKNKKICIKSFIMNSKIVVGVGNIYATEALFLAKIHPLTPAKTLSNSSLQSLVKAIKNVLKKAIQQGGTTLKDFLNSEGNPGYFAHHLNAYGRTNQPCLVCQTPLSSIQIAKRTTVYCPNCQQR